MTEALGAAKRFVPPCHFTLHTALTTDRPARGQGRGGAASYRPRQKIIFIYTSQSRAPTQSGRRWEVFVSDEMCGLEVFESPRRKTDTIRTLGDRRRRAAATQPAARRRHAPNTEPSKLKKISMCIGNAFHCVTVTQLYLYCKMNGNKHINT